MALRPVGRVPARDQAVQTGDTGFPPGPRGVQTEHVLGQTEQHRTWSKSNETHRRRRAAGWSPGQRGVTRARLLESGRALSRFPDR
jgi:hypothetical protein